ncbi:patatin-like phospholipase family protein [Azoarcus sp. DN11]|uniref:patatin-like phospholipase family protein n=1 Tax=Azoarcus sp. DN11 TaxID=356837 RepID=UPI000EAE47CF|nr:patatin-like phospholipase family protein [Azoarcus sp. DN11]AYH43369.1 esterase [Azoarcus sp. DN11]
MLRKRWWTTKNGELPAINLALQGGGAHGAYTWGVLDRLLEEGWKLEGISGTSAGAMNAVALAQGWTRGGGEGARESLSNFWEAIAGSSPLELDLLHSLNPAGNGALPNPLSVMVGMTRLLSPYQFNPLELNPLRDVVRAQFDFEYLRKECRLKLFIAATRAQSGKVRLFRTAELTEDMLLASACLPTMHHAVEIGGEAYWDGGFSANPAVYPLMYECDTPDILLVLLNPLQISTAPRSAAEIADRTVELGFSATFLREMRMIAHARAYIEAGSNWVPQGRFERKLMALRFHMIEAQELADTGNGSKLNAARAFLHELRDLGRARAARWIRTKRPQVGKQGTVNLGDVFA